MDMRIRYIFYYYNKRDEMAIKKIGIDSRCDRSEVIEMVKEILAHFSSKVQIFVATPTAGILGIEGTSEYCQDERSSSYTRD